MKFKNVSYEGAIDFLSGREVGDFIIRPSSKGKNNLTITWKFYDFTYVHLDIDECLKGPNDLIGRKLKLKDITYDNLDEIIACYIQPCNMLVRQIKAHKKFETGAPDTIELKLKQEKEKDSKTIPYLFGFSSDAPQYLILFYVAKGMEITKEYIKIKPKGLLFHDLTFPNLINLINWFKTNFKKIEYQNHVKLLKPPILAPKASQNVKMEKSESFLGAASHFNVIGTEIDDLRVKQETKVEGKFGTKREAERLCNTCRQAGHLANNCPMANEKQKGSKSFKGDNNDSSNRFNKRKFSETSGEHNKNQLPSSDVVWGLRNDNREINVKQEHNLGDIKREAESLTTNNWLKNDRGWAVDSLPSKPLAPSSRVIQESNRRLYRNDRDRSERVDRYDRGGRNDRRDRENRNYRGEKGDRDRNRDHSRGPKSKKL